MGASNLLDSGRVAGGNERLPSAERPGSEAFALSLGSGSLTRSPSLRTRSRSSEWALRCSVPCSSLDDGGPVVVPRRQVAGSGSRGQGALQAGTNHWQNTAHCRAFVSYPDQWALVLSSGNSVSLEALLCRPMSGEQISASAVFSLVTRPLQPVGNMGSCPGQPPWPSSVPDLLLDLAHTPPHPRPQFHQSNWLVCLCASLGYSELGK